ncbi:MAG: PmoA family protein [Planctomycetota bacterium]
MRLTVLAMALGIAATGNGDVSAARFAIEESAHGVTVTVDGKPFAGYVVDKSNKPYLWPVHGPDGTAMTRAYPMEDLPAEPASQRDHPHHRGISFGHEDCGGDTWHDRSTFAELSKTQADDPRARQSLDRLGAIKHREFTRLAAEPERAVVESICDHLDPGGSRVLVEYRRLVFRATAASRTLDIDQDLVAGDRPVRLGDKKDAGLFIRVPVGVAVDSQQGGQIVNSEGLTDAEAWAQPARWCDYHGQSDGKPVGIAILNHPDSYRHPTRWHVRPYGLFAANPFAQRAFDPKLPDGGTTLRPGEVLRLRHRFVFHAGDEQAAGIPQVWEDYARESPGDVMPQR